MTRVRSHPGQLLRTELEARDLSANQLALALRVPANRITGILRGERSITAETALRLGRFLGTGAAFWMNLTDRSRHLSGGGRGRGSNRGRSGRAIPLRERAK